ncbi:ADPribosylarginine hydrolase [Acanthamoeba castellanii str. Neff]|uniref:ADP-ribosylhydrolase ARH1 n=1 Tax=Acanthamoeba castellanii (strain ATCC 30010 / Neff) TaxID=1257118 RepID=L8GKJ7_ACACF|nr:ADPribosylarginine hydrolase [Acanthamoeba castellanii str. Neff]ELR13253.1 ADPribosylarginine hydrolase [Acanthamoeba castellanii str. Neff]
MEQRYRAAMVLGGVGDAIGFRNGKWEFLKDGPRIHAQLGELGGISALTVNRRDWRVSDDTVMHIATAEALVDDWESMKDLEDKLARKYVACGKDMEGRAAGEKTMETLMMMEGIIPFEGTRITPVPWNQIPYDPKGGGCGGAMRAMCIGLRFPGEANRDRLVELSIESGRMTHNHPVGFLGAFASALFTAFAVEGLPLPKWGHGLLEHLPKAKEYLQGVGRDVEHYAEGIDYFEKAWMKYMEERGLFHSDVPAFPARWGVVERDAFYKKLSFDGWGGSSGSSWNELLLKAALHAGDSDSTGSIAASLWGAIHGMRGVPENHYRNLEYRDRLENLAELLYLFGGAAQWACGTCTFLNARHNATCDMCSASRG